MVIADARSGSIVTANASAARLLGISRRALAGMPLPTMLESGGTAELRSALATARVAGVAQVGSVRVRGTALDASVRLSLVRTGEANYVLVHFTSIETELVVSERLHGVSPVFDAIERGDSALAVTDAEFNLVYANGAFLRLIEVDSLPAARGRALLHWFRLSAADLGRMRAEMAVHQMATAVSVSLCARRHGRPDLQALAVAVPDRHQPLWGFSISERPRLN